MAHKWKDIKMKKNNPQPNVENICRGIVGIVTLVGSIGIYLAGDKSIALFLLIGAILLLIKTYMENK